MMDMMRACWQWMMSLGVVGMVVGAALLVGLVAFIVWLIGRLARKSNRPSPG